VFAAIAILSLTLAIGPTTAVFRLLDAVLLRQLPVSEPETLERFEEVRQDGSISSDVFSAPLYRDLRRSTARAYSGLLARRVRAATLLLSGPDPVRGVVELVSGNYFQVLGTHAEIGRLLTDDDDRVTMGHPVAVISHSFWGRYLSGDPHALNTTIRVNGYPFTVVGVAPPGFFGVEVGASPQIWIPLTMQPASEEDGRNVLSNFDYPFLNIVGRRAPGVTRAQAQLATDLAVRGIMEERSGSSQRARSVPTVRLQPAGRGLSRLQSSFQRPLYIVMAVAVLALIIACANVAGLLIARAAARRREICVQMALGASRGRLVRQFLMEGMLLSAVGGGLGLASSAWVISALLAFLPSQFVPLSLQVETDIRSVAFTLLVTVGSTLLFALLPAVLATRVPIALSLKGESPHAGRSRAFSSRRALVALQVALSMTLLTAAGLLVQSLTKAEATDLGTKGEPRNVMMATVRLAGRDYTRERCAAFFRDAETAIRNIPGVVAVGFGSRVLELDLDRNTPVKRDLADTLRSADAGAGFFSALGVPVVRGKEFSPGADNSGSVILNQTAANRLFPGRDPIGQPLGTGLVVVGVVGDTKLDDPHAPVVANVYSYVSPIASEWMIYVRTSARAYVAPNELRRVVHGVDASVPVFELKTLQEQKDGVFVRERLTAVASIFFGLLSLLLAVIGLYGLIAYTVAARSKDIAVRIALGARSETAVWLVLREALATVLGGIVIGLLLSLALGHGLASQLVGISPNDPVTIAIAGAVLLGSALIAAFIPATKASHVDPALLLRHE
jgi:predicted permease